MLVDLHAHTKGISHCCRIYAEDVIINAVENGFDGLAIANHYTSSYFSDETYDEWIEKYIEEWKLCQRLGKEKGIKIYNAVEVTMEYEPRVHILIYGADENFLRNYPKLCNKQLSELYKLCQNNGCALVQAHPFRGGATVQEVTYLHGIEINCHPKYQNSYAEDIFKIAKENSLAVTVGCDYHADTHRPKGGTFLPDTINTDKDLANYILTAKTFEMQIQEPADNKISFRIFER